MGRDGVVYVGSEANSVRALRPEDGTLLWEYDTNNDVKEAGAIGANGLLYIGDDSGTLYAIGIEQMVLPELAGVGARASWPMLGHDAAHRGLGAPGPADGDVRWSTALGAASEGGVVLGPDGLAYAGTTAGRLVSLDASGVLRWATALGSPLRGTPVVAASGDVYVSSDAASVHAVDAAGTIRWSFGVLPASERRAVRPHCAEHRRAL